MPVERVQIVRVTSSDTRKPGCRQHVIDAQTVSDPVRWRQYQTVNDWRAAICDRAAQTKQIVVIGSRDTVYGKEVITVELEQPEAA